MRALACWVNLFGHPVHRWDRKWARASAAEVLATKRLFTGVTGVVLMGTRVRDAFAIDPAVTICRWFNVGVRMALMPHPSGRNRYWNETANVQRVERFLRRAVKEAKRGQHGHLRTRSTRHACAGYERRSLPTSQAHT
jgi:hypothetical protein